MSFADVLVCDDDQQGHLFPNKAGSSCVYRLTMYRLLRHRNDTDKKVMFVVEVNFFTRPK